MSGIPGPIADALPTDAEQRLGAYLADEGRVCEGAKFHSPNPLVLHEVRLPGGREVLLCGTCRDQLRVLHLLGPNPDWSVARCFGNRVRLLLGRR